MTKIDEKSSLCDCYIKLLDKSDKQYESLLQTENSGESYILLSGENFSALPGGQLFLQNIDDLSGGSLGLLNGQATVSRGKYLVYFTAVGAKIDQRLKIELYKNGAPQNSGLEFSGETKHAVTEVRERALLALFNSGDVPITYKKVSLLIVKLS